MASQYPSPNDRDFNLLQKITNNTALLSDTEAGDVASVNGRTGVVVLTKSDVSLDNVTNNAQALAGLVAASLLTTPTATIVGRSTAGTGALESLTAASVKTLLSLNNVENTALSTWAGSGNITTLGTITSLTTSGAIIAGTGVTVGNGNLTLGNGPLVMPSTSYFKGNAPAGYRFNNAADTVTLLQVFDAGNATLFGSLTTGAPTTGTAAAWKLGVKVDAVVVFDTAKYLQVDIAGTLYKVALAS